MELMMKSQVLEKKFRDDILFFYFLFWLSFKSEGYPYSIAAINDKSPFS
jgi:hypothetical protein